MIIVHRDRHKKLLSNFDHALPKLNSYGPRFVFNVVAAKEVVVVVILCDLKPSLTSGKSTEFPNRD